MSRRLQSLTLALVLATMAGCAVEATDDPPAPEPDDTTADAAAPSMKTTATGSKIQ